MADSAIMTADLLIDAFARPKVNGTSVVSDGLNVAAPTVSNWRARGKIPSEYWADLVELARECDVKGITLETLAAMHARRPADADTAEARV
jgi:hypothetical protein